MNKIQLRHFARTRSHLNAMGPRTLSLNLSEFKTKIVSEYGAAAEASNMNSTLSAVFQVGVHSILDL